jgi:hypothetical protein
MNFCCPCDELKHPGKPQISVGLTALPRQLAGFPEYRLAMLRDIPTHEPLDRWRARQDNDLGIMLLEMWAYVLDILSFYDERIANETYLRTALQQSSMHQLVQLIGYRPRPDLAATVVLATIAEGKQPVTLPPRTGFRSDAFDGEPPQIFETDIEQIIHPFRNEWTLAEVRDKFPNNELLLDLNTVRLAERQLVLLRWSSQLQAGRVNSIQTIAALDGNSYVKLEIEPKLTLDPAIELEQVDVLTPTLTASPNLFASSPVTNTTIVLDAVYPQFAVGDPIIIQRGNNLEAKTITHIDLSHVPISPEVNRRPITDIALGNVESSSQVSLSPVIASATSSGISSVSSNIPSTTLPATRITLNSSLPSGWISTPSSSIVHFQMVKGGTLTRIAKTHLEVSDFAPPGIAIAGIVEPLSESMATVGQFLLLDANDSGLLVDGVVTITDRGEGSVKLDADTLAFNPTLRTPVRVFGNPINASRGESVFNEVLGSGDAAQAFQSFALRKKPLTYFNDPSAPNGRRSTLEVRVNGIQWTEVPSFFGTGPEDEVYIVRQNDQQDTTIVFGDGRTGARVPTGINNITATYRFGAGAAKPPPGAIGQLAKPVDGLRRVVNPVAAGGGKEGDRPQDIRTNAPNSALILGRAVSLQDFEALAREFGGVVNARAEWAWDETLQRAVVKIWFISDGGNIAKALQSFLIGQADPSTPLVATEATAQTPSNLVINLAIDPRSNTQTAIEQIRQTLTNSETGILSLANVPIGRPLFRSRIFEAILAVAGTRSIEAMTVDGQPAPFAISTDEGRYRNFLDNLVIQKVGLGNPIATSTGGGVIL